MVILTIVNYIFCSIEREKICELNGNLALFFMNGGNNGVIFESNRRINGMGYGG